MSVVATKVSVPTMLTTGTAGTRANNVTPQVSVAMGRRGVNCVSRCWHETATCAKSAWLTVDTHLPPK